MVLIIAMLLSLFAFFPIFNFFPFIPFFSLFFLFLPFYFFPFIPFFSLSPFFFYYLSTIFISLPPLGEYNIYSPLHHEISFFFCKRNIHFQLVFFRAIFFVFWFFSMNLYPYPGLFVHCAHFHQTEPNDIGCLLLQIMKSLTLVT